MRFICLHDKKKIGQFLRKNIYLNIYGIGDLDDFLWPHTTWYGFGTDSNIEAIALLYSRQLPPVLLALSEEPAIMQALLKSVQHLLPYRFYAHLSPGLEGVFSNTHDLESHGEHYKMALNDRTTMFSFDCSGVIRLNKADEKNSWEFYRESYPGNWFDPKMLQTNQYFGIMKDDRLISVAGVHVYSPQYGVAALGNIATHPSHRGKGYGKSATAKVCQSLLNHGINHIGLNVKADNMIAVSCYEKLGFEIVASYSEFVIQVR